MKGVYSQRMISYKCIPYELSHGGKMVLVSDRVST